MMRNHGFIIFKHYLFLDMKVDNKTYLAYMLGFIKGFD